MKIIFLSLVMSLGLISLASANASDKTVSSFECVLEDGNKRIFDVAIYAIENEEYFTSRVDLVMDGVRFLEDERSDSDGIYMQNPWEVSNDLIKLAIKPDGTATGSFIDDENDGIPARLKGNCKIQE